MKNPPDGRLPPVAGAYVDGLLVDVQSGEIYPASLTIRWGRVTRIEHLETAPDRYIVPGLIDAHIHIESSLLTPFRFAEKAVAHGTTAVVTNPHEIANVMGMGGVGFMVQDGQGTPLRHFFTAPSCVPSTRMETSGAVFGAAEMEDMLRRLDFVALGEVMDVQEVLSGDPEVMARIEVAARTGKPVDGHCPGLRGEQLDSYIRAGISTDHECLSLEEAEEKHRKGMTVMVREGSASRDLEALLPFAAGHRHFLVSDDLQAADLMQGHVDALLRKAVALGMEPLHAIRSATLWPAQHYGLPGGWVRVGGAADLTVVRDLRSFQVLETWIAGELVAKDGKALFTGSPLTAPSGISVTGVDAKELSVKAPGGRAEVRVIEVVPEHIVSRAGHAELAVVRDIVAPDPTQDVLMVAVVNRYIPARPAVAFIRGFGLTDGAIASSVAHDSHNIIAVGVDPRSMARAVNELIAQGGGLYAFNGGRGIGLELPIAGLMSARPCEEVAEREAEVNRFVRDMGCPLPAPFMTLSFQSLLVVPQLKLGDRGLFDSVRQRFVSPVISSAVPR